MNKVMAILAVGHELYLSSSAKGQINPRFTSISGSTVVLDLLERCRNETRNPYIEYEFDGKCGEIFALHEFDKKHGFNQNRTMLRDCRAITVGRRAGRKFTLQGIQAKNPCNNERIAVSPRLQRTFIPSTYHGHNTGELNWILGCEQVLESLGIITAPPNATNCRPLQRKFFGKMETELISLRRAYHRRHN